MTVALVAAALLVIAASTLLTAAIASWLPVTRLLDVPNERSLHEHPTPRGGGVVIVSLTLLPLAIVGVLRPDLVSNVYRGIVIGGLLVSAVSLLDDISDVRAGARLTVHFAAGAIVLFYTDLDRLSIPLVGAGTAAIVRDVLVLVWIAAMINAYNFMDGIDGLGGSQGVIAGVGWGIIGWQTGSAGAELAGLLVASACAGFLFQNWPPARIFMGDVGSAFLGFMFAALPIVEIQRDPRSAWAAILLMWPFLFDTGATLVRRLVRGEDVLSAHRSHLYQRLVITGLSHTRVSLLYIGLALLGLLAAVGAIGWFVAILAIGVAATALVLFVTVRERAVRLQPTSTFCPHQDV